MPPGLCALHNALAKFSLGYELKLSARKKLCNLWYVCLIEMAVLRVICASSFLISLGLNPLPWSPSLLPACLHLPCRLTSPMQPAFALLTYWGWALSSTFLLTSCWVSCLVNSSPCVSKMHKWRILSVSDHDCQNHKINNINAIGYERSYGLWYKRERYQRQI